MKAIIFVFSIIYLMCVPFYDYAQESNNGSKITFEKTLHDFGQMYQGDKAEYYFKFFNTGNQPLILSNVSSSCGCTVPEWPKNPIMPNDSAVVKVKYNSNIIGNINKQVTITSNAINNTAVSLRINGNVNKKPNEIIPINLNSPVMVPVN